MNDLLALFFVAIMALSIVYADRAMPAPPVKEGPAPKLVVVNHIEKHEPRLVTKVTK
jgi:hypothetical protein